MSIDGRAFLVLFGARYLKFLRNGMKIMLSASVAYCCMLVNLDAEMVKE